MRCVVQRVESAWVEVNGKKIAEIGFGLLALVGVHTSDVPVDATWIADKLVSLRIFDDLDGRMNLSALDVGGAALLVSQFTLHGDARSGRRPGYSTAAPGDLAEPLFRAVADAVTGAGVITEVGIFGAQMRVGLVNNGPVTILLDSHKTF